ncbi:MAG: Lrp/AsnC family transcriptional regulator [Acidimicrobiales bacterium]
MHTVARQLDELDRSVIARLRDAPRTPVTRLARLVGVARGTAQARLDRLTRGGVITGFGPDVDAAAAGFPVTAFTLLTIAQGAHEEVVRRLEAVPEVIEVFTVTGSGDMLCRIVARSNDHLHEILQGVVASPEVVRTETRLALAAPIRRSVADLIAGSVQPP